MDMYSNTNYTNRYSIKSNLNFSNFSDNQIFKNIKLLKDLNEKYKNYSANKFDENVTVIPFYSVIVLISLFGNLLVVFVIMKNKTMRTKTNILMANITISGLCDCI